MIHQLLVKYWKYKRREKVLREQGFLVNCRTCKAELNAAGVQAVKTNSKGLEGYSYTCACGVTSTFCMDLAPVPICLESHLSPSST